MSFSLTTRERQILGSRIGKPQDVSKNAALTPFPYPASQPNFIYTPNMQSYLWMAVLIRFADTWNMLRDLDPSQTFSCRLYAIGELFNIVVFMRSHPPPTPRTKEAQYVLAIRATVSDYPMNRDGLSYIRTSHVQSRSQNECKQELCLEAALPPPAYFKMSIWPQ
jgi:hypothetical protein